MKTALSRRDFLATAAVGALSGPQWRRYPDPATEFQVLRLTDPAFSSGMSAAHLSRFTRASNRLLYWSDHTGSQQAFQMNLKDGTSQQLSDAAALDPASLTLSQDERDVLYFDGPALNACALVTLKARELYRAPEDTQRKGFTIGSDGTAAFVEEAAGKSRIISISTSALQPQRRQVVAELEGVIDGIMARPRHPQLFYRSGGGFWIINRNGSGKRQLKVAAATNGSALWAPSGRTLLYLHTPDDSRELVTLREHNPDDNSDQLVAKTSQFISAAPNADASVFTGSSRSVASAYVLILLRVTQRELTLCEHRASDPSMVQPAFTPDSANILFVSDRHGKPAIYMVGVSKFVEQTKGEQAGDAR